MSVSERKESRRERKKEHERTREVSDITSLELVMFFFLFAFLDFLFFSFRYKKYTRVLSKVSSLQFFSFLERGMCKYHIFNIRVIFVLSLYRRKHYIQLCVSSIITVLYLLSEKKSRKYKNR